MKKELFAAALLILILALSLINTRAITNICDDLKDAVAQAGEAAEAGDWGESTRLINSAISLWQSHDVYTHIVLRHTDIETLSDDFFELSEHINSQDTGSVRSAVRLVQEHLTGIVEMESFKPGSIF